RNSRNVWIHDVNIHGLAQNGINAGGLSSWTMERVKINANGRAGWDANIGSGSSNSGQMVLREVEIGWNGCGERWKTGEPWACWAQQTGGYGDGLGTIDTGGQWLVEDSFIHHNTSDGLDFRYMDGADSTHVTLRRVYAVANAGNQVKVRGNATVENSVLVSECAYFEGKHYMVTDDNCRAGGNTLQFVPTSNDKILVRHNTITGEGGVLIGANEGDSSSHIDIRNNVLIGFPAFRKPSVQSSVYYANNAPAQVSWDGNLMWNVKDNEYACPSGSICGKDPMLADMTLRGFNAEPRDGSPVIDRVSLLAGIDTDFLLQPRPVGTASDIGAYEMQPVVEVEPTIVAPPMSRNTPPMLVVAPTASNRPVAPVAPVSDARPDIDASTPGPLAHGDVAPVAPARIEVKTAFVRFAEHAWHSFARLIGSAWQAEASVPPAQVQQSAPRQPTGTSAATHVVAPYQATAPHQAVAPELLRATVEPRRAAGWRYAVHGWKAAVGIEPPPRMGTVHAR
uniref:choice-of-anchor Q domain-containing protein n=1 Tax=Novilysobacter viscosus TaxID=3098602 RepID=UPI002ED957C9